MISVKICPNGLFILMKIHKVLFLKLILYIILNNVENVPEVLVLQEDNTYQPAPIVYQPLPKSVNISNLNQCDN